MPLPLDYKLKGLTVLSILVLIARLAVSKCLMRLAVSNMFWHFFNLQIIFLIVNILFTKQIMNMMLLTFLLLLLPVRFFFLQH
ncbi:hypothetical protein CWR48_15290 [Oceanobacillus arenosus]|uniref:Uncharacterized protein n=1 Tax=Oceanobacillus arenosus TaxID=1229153 RepID=A0A3D8PNY8_9BACI|nr:hypothetical protein CWR48_15290 [Oceanobacillus arenosus]